jgi:hypothetical protein
MNAFETFILLVILVIVFSEISGSNFVMALDLVLKLYVKNWPLWCKFAHAQLNNLLVIISNYSRFTFELHGL